jgi:hypothetical protein
MYARDRKSSLPRVYLNYKVHSRCLFIKMKLYFFVFLYFSSRPSFFPKILFLKMKIPLLEPKYPEVGYTYRSKARAVDENVMKILFCFIVFTLLFLLYFKGLGPKILARVPCSGRGVRRAPVQWSRACEPGRRSRPWPRATCVWWSRTRVRRSSTCR